MAWFIEKLEDAGYVGEKVVLKSGQEPSIVALKKGHPVRKRFLAIAKVRPRFKKI